MLPLHDYLFLCVSSFSAQLEWSRRRRKEPDKQEREAKDAIFCRSRAEQRGSGP